MAKMLLASASTDRGKNFWYCCWGHDGWNRATRIIRKRIMRRKEKSAYRKEIASD